MAASTATPYVALGKRECSVSKKSMSHPLLAAILATRMLRFLRPEAFPWEAVILLDGTGLDFEVGSSQSRVPHRSIDGDGALYRHRHRPGPTLRWRWRWRSIRTLYRHRSGRYRLHALATAWGATSACIHKDLLPN
ncbi:hypothetical protein BKA56DRAFT_313404 [Ilyonectria sp. MPI-CAGE-AT-0026]|nr:hypothetical protein BKA56DRAFT_313404 [Ilyonectria sp. MPI-CAGE-AT-0026]